MSRQDRPGEEAPDLEDAEALRRANEHNVPVYLTTEKEWVADRTALDAWHDRAS